jgi:hypothetical protein
MNTPRLSRRNLSLVALGVAATLALTACGGGSTATDPGTADAATTSAPATTTTTAAPTTPTTPTTPDAQSPSEAPSPSGAPFGVCPADFLAAAEAQEVPPSFTKEGSHQPVMPAAFADYLRADGSACIAVWGAQALTVIFLPVSAAEAATALETSGFGPGPGGGGNGVFRFIENSSGNLWIARITDLEDGSRHTLVSGTVTYDLAAIMGAFPTLIEIS